MTARPLCVALLSAALASCARQLQPPPPPAPAPAATAPTTTGAAAPQPKAPAPTPAPTPVGRPTTPTAVPTDSSVVFERPNATLLRPGTLVYQLFTLRDTVRTPQGIRTVVVSESTVGGVPGWLVAESRTGTAVETSDSLYVTRVDLAPERWVAAAGRSRLAVSFTRDSMYGALQTYQGRSSFAAEVPSGALLTTGMIERLLELAPLGAGYRAAASLVQLDLGSPRVVPAQLAVLRDESVTLPDRIVDCWVVALRAGGSEERFWVSKDAPRVIKTEQVTSGGTLVALLQP